jgi:hypothetical protein
VIQRLLFSVLLVLVSANMAHAESQQVIMGWVENVSLDVLGTELKAKLDTGAKTSSMRAEVVNVIDAEKEGENRRVVFRVEGKDGKMVTLERKLVRWVRIKSRKGGEYIRRPVVEMDYCIAGKRVHSEVNLAPRSDFIYPILIGRNMMSEGNILVDPRKTFTAKPNCPAAESKEE